MAVDMFIKIGKFEGESADKKHKDKSEVLSWSLGMSQSGTMHASTGGGGGKASVQDLSLMKYMDKSTPDIINACVTGEHIEEVTLIMRKAGGTEALEFFTIKLTDVLVSSYSTGASGNEERGTENVSLNFREYEIMYQPQDKNGAKKGGEVKTHFNIAEQAVE